MGDKEYFTTTIDRLSDIYNKLKINIIILEIHPCPVRAGDLVLL